MKPIGPARRLVAVMLAIVLGGAVLPGRIPGAAADPPVEAEGEDSGPSPGYWVVGRDGGVFAFGGATFLGSTGAVRLNQPVVGMAPTRTGDGYWLAAADGGIFTFGQARFHGSTGATRLNRPVVGIAATPTGLVTYDGQLKTLLSVDEMIDRMMTELANTGQLDNTLVILTSDNGFAHGDRGLTSKGMGYMEHSRVPYLVRWDGVFKPGTVDHRLVGGEDFLPTYLDAARYLPPALKYRLDGRSFLPGRPDRSEKLLEFGPVGRPTPNGYKGHRSIPTWASLVGDRWQYIEYYEADNTGVAFREYYDLESDPWELENVLADKDPNNDPDVEDLSARLARAVHCAGRSCP